MFHVQSEISYKLIINYNLYLIYHGIRSKFLLISTVGCCHEFGLSIFETESHQIHPFSIEVLVICLLLIFIRILIPEANKDIKKC